MPLVANRPTQELVDLVGALGGRWIGNIAMCRCPAHSDADPSLSIRQGDQGILVTCFAGCDREDVLRELGRIRPDRHHPMPAAVQARRTSNGAHIWDQAIDVRGTLGERYLDHRNLLPPPPDVRFHPRCPTFQSRKRCSSRRSLLRSARSGSWLPFNASSSIRLAPITFARSC